MQFKVEHAIDDAEWQAIADRCDCATFFHTPLWYRAFAASHLGTSVATRLFRFADGRVALFPLARVRRLAGLHTVHVSSPASCYGGCIAPDPLAPEETSAIATWIVRHVPNLVWRLNPLDPARGMLEPLVTEPDTTEMLRLTDFPDAAALRKNYDYAVRKQVGKGTRAGLRAAPAERWEEWEAYYAIYQARLRDWGDAVTSRYPLALFRRFFDAASPAARLWLVWSGDRIAGGNLNFYHGRHAVEWHAAYDGEFFKVGVRDFLVDAIIEDARARGFAFYDFNPSGGHEGARRFKQTFGTISMPSGVIVRRRGLYRLDALRAAARALRRRT